MKKLISVRMASIILLIINTLMLLLHTLILIKILPHDFIWGGQIKNNSDLLRLESISIFIQIVFIFIIALKAGYIFSGKFKRAANIGTWVMFCFMLLNIVANLASSSGLEKIIMTPLTFVLAFLLLRVAIEKDNNNDITISH